MDLAKNSFILLSFFIPFFIFSCEESKPIEVEQGVSISLAKHRKLTINNVAYNLEFNIPRNLNNKINGKAIIEFDLDKVNSDVVLDFENPSEQLIEVLSTSTNKIDVDLEYNHIIIPKKHLTVGRNSFTVNFIAGEQALNRNEEFLYTLFVPNKASTAFPCFDQPNIKAKYSLSLTVPRGWTALANSPQTKNRTIDNQVVFNFKETLPISTYLFAFTAGKFSTITDTLDGIEMTLYHRETDLEKVSKNAPIVFDLHQKSIRWLEEYTGIEQPFEKFDFALIPAFQFGGMEHPGAIFYKDRSLFLEDNATVNQKMSRNSLIAHETAHMWFGNLVTMDWFNDVWLKEVFANFMAAKMVNPNFPEINHDLRFLQRHQPSAYGEDRSSGSHPIQQKLENLNQASLLYGRIIYQKAPVVMKQLEAIMGVENFRLGLQEYLHAFSFDNATWDDLIAILDKRTDLDLKAWSQAWVKEAGMPWIKAELKSKNGKISTYELVFQNRTSSGNIWQENSQLLTSTKGYINRYPLQIINEMTVVTELEGQVIPDFILPNASEKAYGFFELDEKSKNYLLSNIQNIEDELAKSAAWFSLWEAMLHGTITPEQLLETIVIGLPKEKEIQGLSRRLGYLQTIYWGYLNSDDQLKNAEEIENLLWQLLQQSNSSGRKKTLFDAYVNITRSPAGIKRLRDIWDKKLVIKEFMLSEDDFTTLAYELAIRDVPNSTEILQGQLNSITNPDRQEAMAFILPALSDQESVRDTFFESLKQVANRQKEPWVARALQYLHHPLRAKSAEKYIVPSLELVQEIQQTGGIFFPKRWSATILNGHQSIEAKNLVDQFLNNLPAEYPIKLKNKILQSADPLERKSKIVQKAF
jgi:aminopeptidase N